VWFEHFLDVNMHSDVQLACKEGRLRATVGWRHAFGDVTAKKTMAFEGGQNEAKREVGPRPAYADCSQAWVHCGCTP